MGTPERRNGNCVAFQPTEISIRKNGMSEEKERIGPCFNCGFRKRLFDRHSEGPLFSPSVTNWKDSVHPQSNKTNRMHVLLNTDSISLTSEADLCYNCRALNADRSSISSDVTTNSTRQEAATCILSSDTANCLSKVKMASTTCRSCLEISYQDCSHQLAKRISPTKNSHDLNATTFSGLPCQDCRKSKISSIFFKTLPSSCNILFSIPLLYEALFNVKGGSTRASTSRNKPMEKAPKVSTLTTYVLLFLFASSVVSGDFARIRHRFRGRFGHRYPRQSGFRRGPRKPDSDRCEAIKVPICKDIGYNKTDMSLSIMNKLSQSEAANEVQLFLPLVKLNCSSELKLFLCSIYTPICMEGYPKFLPPCRFVCERVRSGCLPIMQKFETDWPEKLRCEHFPEYAVGKAMCMHFNLTRSREEASNPEGKHKTHMIKPTPSRRRTTSKSVKSTTRSTVKTSSPTTPSTAKVASTPSLDIEGKDEQRPDLKDVFDGEKYGGDSSSFPSTNRTLPSCACRKPMVIIIDTTDALYSRVTTGGVPNCAISCKSPYFTDEQISVAEIWIKSWSIVCFVVTLMTVSTFLIDMERFKYPERPIIFLSTCYMFVSIGFLIRIVAGHEAVACAYQTDHVLYHTTGPLLCTTVFLLIYFFSMASALWWVILSMTWFLAAGLKWGSEAIEKYSQYYHAVAWLIPSLQTIMVLAMSSVDGDSLSGICFVGNQDVRSLRGFVLAPLVVYLALGGMFLLAGFVSLFRIRNRIKKEGTKTKKLEKLMGRIGIFSVLYMVPAAALVACYFYEQQYRPFWEYSHNCLPSEKTRTSHPIFAPVRPEFLVSMVRYLMTLLIGVTNGVWICSSKTLDSWSRFYGSVGHCQKSPDKDIENSVSCQEDLKTVRRAGRNSAEPSDQEPDNRSDSYQARYHDNKSIRHGGSSKSESVNHRRSRHSGSYENSSRAPSGVRCEACDRTSHCSSQNPSAGDSHKKRRRSKSTSSKSSRLESSRRRQTESESKSKECDLLCENNTTSTDGSDRPQAGSGQSGCANESVSNQNDSIQKDQSRNGPVTPVSDGHRNGLCHFCNETNRNRFTLNGHYAINFNDNLPPCTSRPAMSHDQGVGKSASSLPTSDCDEEVQNPLLNQSSSYDYESPAAKSPYYHYHHHHYHGGLR